MLRSSRILGRGDLIIFSLTIVVVYALGYYIAVSSAHDRGISTETFITEPEFVDATEYVEIAQAMISEGRFTWLQQGGAPEVARTPVYPAFLAAILYVFGSVQAIPLVQILLAALTGLLIVLIGEQYFGRIVGYAAAIIYLATPTVASLAFTSYTETLFVASLLLAVYCAGVIDERPRFAVLAGIIFGIMGLVRPVGLFLIGAFLLYICISNVNWRRGAQIAALFLSGAAIVLVPWMIRNQYVSGNFRISSAGTYNMLFINVAKFEGARRNMSILEAHAEFDAVLGSRDRSFDSAHKQGELIWKYMSSRPHEYAYFHVARSVSYVYSIGADRLWAVTFPTWSQARPPKGQEWSFQSFSKFKHAHNVSNVFQTMSALIATCVAVVYLKRGRSRELHGAFLLISIPISLALFSGVYDIRRIHIPAEPFLYLLAAQGAFVAVRISTDVLKRRLSIVAPKISKNRPPPYNIGIFMARIAPIAVACVIVAATAGFALLPPQKEPKQVSSSELYWNGRIETIGGERAYEELAGDIASSRPQEQHTRAHEFGGALYTVLGVEGIAICDSRFSFACHHEFLGRAIHDLGLSSVVPLNQKCFDSLSKSPLSCQHGIGHGIVSFLGYDEDSFMRALEVCRDLPYGDPIGGCYGGVFMEYNMQIMLGEEGKLRPLKGEEWLAPCDTLPSEYQSACAYWQPQWWNITLRDRGMLDIPERYKFMGSQCEQLGSSSLVHDCFGGIGNIVPASVEFDPVKSRSLCEVVSSTPLYQLLCKSTAANSLTLGGGGQKGDGRVVCDGLMSDHLEYCLAQADNKGSVAKKPTI